MAAVGAPFWGEKGYLTQGIENDPRKLRGMLRRLGLDGWNDPAGKEANATRWTAICKAPNRETLRGNGPEYRTKWSRGHCAILLGTDLTVDFFMILIRCGSSGAAAGARGCGVRPCERAPRSCAPHRYCRRPGTAAALKLHATVLAGAHRSIERKPPPPPPPRTRKEKKRAEKEVAAAVAWNAANAAQQPHDDY